MLSFAGPLVVVGADRYLLAVHGQEIEQAVKRIELWPARARHAACVLTLLARTEAVVACLCAMENRPRRVDIHSANSVTFLASTINHYVSSIVRGALMRNESTQTGLPTIPQMIMVDTATTLIEGLVVAILIVSQRRSAEDCVVDSAAARPGGDLARIVAALLARRRFARYKVAPGAGCTRPFATSKRRCGADDHGGRAQVAGLYRPAGGRPESLAVAGDGDVRCRRSALESVRRPRRGQRRRTTTGLRAQPASPRPPQPDWCYRSPRCWRACSTRLWEGRCSSGASDGHWREGSPVPGLYGGPHRRIHRSSAAIACMASSGLGPFMSA